MKLTKLLLTGFLALMATAMIGCGEESSNSTSTPNSTGTPSSEAPAGHTHSYTQGVCECGDIQTPTINVKGKTYIVTEMLGIYDKDNAPTDEQRTACESFIQRTNEVTLGGKYVFNADGSVTVELAESVDQPEITYVQTGNFVTLTAENQKTVLSFIGEKLYATTSYADMADMLNGYIGFSVQTVLTAEKDAPHIHKYVQGECACGDLQAPTLDVKGKTFTLVEINAIYSEETPPTAAQKTTCDQTIIELNKLLANDTECTFLAGGSITIKLPAILVNLLGEVNTSNVSYYQAGDFITLRFGTTTLLVTVEDGMLVTQQELTPELIQLIGADTLEDLTGGYEHLTLQLLFSPESAEA